MSRKNLELLAPAKNAAIGIEAVNHGADAVYIGGPSFGARASASNSVADIAALAAYAHKYFARVYVTLNTALYDDELEDARKLAWQCWEAGADALIIQDMGLLELDLPPIALHASTQADNRTPEKVKFLERAGFSQLVLARELTLEQIEGIARETSVPLEFFVHGALCVCYSGQCYLSQANCGRSANRGECAQPCRLPYTLSDPQGNCLATGHLLSLKDMDQSANVARLAHAGVSSFKIEGRLKDLSYVKNITGHYRRILDGVIQGGGFYPSSSGKTTLFFDPKPQKSFNRGLTPYMVGGGQGDITSFTSPKWVGEPVGRVRNATFDSLTIDGTEKISNGDGLTYFDEGGQLVGMRINRAEGQKLFPAQRIAKIKPGTQLFRNHDQEFERALEKKSAERRVAVSVNFSQTAQGFEVTMTDEDGFGSRATLECPHEDAKNPQKALDAIREQLGKLGGTIFFAANITLDLPAPRHIPLSLLNEARRQAAAGLEEARVHKRPQPASRDQSAKYPQKSLTYLGNVCNRKAREFYARLGVEAIDEGFELSGDKTGDAMLMVTKHCLRRVLKKCLRDNPEDRRELNLKHGGNSYPLEFDCKKCEMIVRAGKRGNS